MYIDTKQLLELASLSHYAFEGVEGCHVTGELVLPVTAANLGAALVLVIAITIVMIIKLQKDKISMAKLIKSMTVQNSSGIVVKRDVNRDYENIEICDQKAAIKIATDIEVNENPAYSTAKGFVN